jgi:hypothetical protein
MSGAGNNRPTIIREADPRHEVASLVRWAAARFKDLAPLNPSEQLALNCILAGALRPAVIAMTFRHTVRRAQLLPVAQRIEKHYNDTGVDLFLYGEPGQCNVCPNTTLKTLDGRYVCFFCSEKAANDFDREKLNAGHKG